MVVWGRKAPTHCISSILMTPSQNHIVTGCNDGSLCVWDVTDTDNWQVHPQTMLFGHSSAVTCLAMGSADTNTSYIVSSTDSGEMCLWDLTDGRCVESTKMSVIHTSVQAYQLLQCRDVRLVCNGYYPEIHVVHPRRLEILFSLCAQVQPDWISALCILRPIKREDDVIVAVTNSGMVKVWTIPGGESKPGPQIFEDESKQIRCLNAQTLRCCAYNQRTVLIVCSKYWQIYDAGDFSLLCSESSRRGERWTGGEFIGIDRVIVWSNEGRGYLYRLPTNVNADNENYRRMADPSSPRQMGPQPYSVLDVYNEKPLECSPVMLYVLGRRGRESKLLLRGDSHGRLSVWQIPDVNDNKAKLVRQDSFENLPVSKPKCVTSLSEEWNRIDPSPEGIIDQLNKTSERMLEVTATIYMPSKGQLACGRDDGSIVLVPASIAIILQLLDSGQDKDSLPHQILHGHTGRVNCLLYPYNESNRYDPNHLVSGGVDFSVSLWDIVTATKLHTFCVHGGEISQLLVPPDNCNPRVLSSVCAVASDHSLSLLSLKERKCIMLASRQLFPIRTVKWRPHDDFVVIGCSDGTVYVWQMETGHLDRVVHGLTAQDILSACEEKQDVGEKLTNPTISIAQAFKRHNLATFRNLAQQQIKKAQDALEQKITRTTHPSLVQCSQASSMMIQGLKTNVKDPDSHVIYFNTEALIVQLLSDEYMSLSPNTLENLGFYTSIPEDPGLSDTQKKVVDFISKVKDKADDVSKKIQSKVDAAGIKSSPLLPRREAETVSGDGTGAGQKPARPPPPNQIPVQDQPTSATLVVAQILMSCLHAWGLDPEVDKLCLSKLGLLHPKRLMSFGFLSTGGQMSLQLPGWYKRLGAVNRQPMMTATTGHWQISTAVTTQHLLAVISVVNTLMSMSNATFIKSRQTRQAVPRSDDGIAELESALQSQNKQGWSHLAALHCVLLPELVGKMQFKPPQLEMLARRWQDRCLEIREAAQALLLAELRRIGPEGRRQVVEQWGPYLPSYVDPATSLLTEHPSSATSANVPDPDDDDEDEDIFGGSDNAVGKLSQSYESRSRQATAIVMMGVIGAEFGAAIEGGKNEPKKGSVAEGFGITNYSHARHTSKALTFLLLQPPSQSLPAFTLIRRAAVDLLGRGFTVWEPYLDVSSVLLGLLELCVDGDKLVPSMTFGLPLTQRADACRTARHALSLIATARPPAFVITMAKEVARHNALAQNNQSQHYHHQLHNSVLIRGKLEILRAIELLVEKIPNDVIDHLAELMDVTIHCLDLNALKNKEINKIVPTLCSKYCMIGFCPNTRRICVGTKSGSLAFYELKQGKCQILSAHGGNVNAVSFSPDGKVLASFSCSDNRLLMWQTASSSLFNIGSHQTKCFKTFNVQAVPLPPSPNPLRLAKLFWIDSRTVLLRCHDGSESRYRI